ncbi:hypothetical protein JCM6882_005590 [Rhodosporidiobolus microsporus]
MLVRNTLIALAAATAANAQLGSLTSGLSASCGSAAYSLISSDFATCSSLGSLLNVFLASGSIVEPVDNWLTTLCTGGQNCTDAAISNATSIIDQGCSEEISSGQALISTVRTLVANFPQVKEGACLASTSNDTFCVTNLLSGVQNATGTDLSFDTVSNLNATSLTSIPTSAVCTDCAHALISELGPVFGANSSSTITGAISSVCGESFTDGQIPSTVSEKTSSNSSTNSSGGAVESSPLNAAGSLDVGAWKMAGAALLGAAGVAALA